jgi:hypothetical protein
MDGQFVTLLQESALKSLTKSKNQVGPYFEC